MGLVRQIIVLGRRRLDPTRQALLGQLGQAGVARGAVPTIIGGSNNRYFVARLPLWTAGAMVALDPLALRSRPWMVTIVVVIVGAVWWPALAASWFRTMPAPPWREEVLRVENACKADPDLQSGSSSAPSGHRTGATHCPSPRTRTCRA